MKIPVVWLSYAPDTLCRGYWDQAMIEDLFSGQLWQVPGGFTFEHYDQGIWPDGDTVVAVIPGRHNAHHVERINHDLRRYRQVLYIFTGDEEAIFPWWLLRDRRKVWAMGARPDRHEGVDVPLGSGYSPGFPSLVGQVQPSPPLDLFFCGQVTHDRRRECVEAIAQHPGERGIIETAQFLADGTSGGLNRADYAASMVAAKVAPCPSGPVSPDSFRLYEALEAGGIPIGDEVTPAGPVPGYWDFVFGESVPFPVVADWATLPKLTDGLVAGWPANAARVSAWYQQWKRKLAYRLQGDLLTLVGMIGPKTDTPDDLISVIIPTCPIPSHPETTMIETVVESIREQLPHAEIVIACDGMRPSFTDHQAAYDEHLRRLTRLCQRWHNVVPVILDEWGHQSGGTRAALELVTTPLVLFAEHDTPLTGDIPWEGLCEVVLSGEVGMVRLNHQTAIHPDHVHMMLDPEPRLYGSQRVPLARTMQWSQRPNLATTAMYRERIMPLFGEHGRTYLEWVMHSAVQHTPPDDPEEGVEATWDRWRVTIYHPDGNIQRSLHLDGRAGASLEDSLAAFEDVQAEARRAAEVPPES